MRECYTAISLISRLIRTPGTQWNSKSRNFQLWGLLEPLGNPWEPPKNSQDNMSSWRKAIAIFLPCLEFTPFHVGSLELGLFGTPGSQGTSFWNQWNQLLEPTEPFLELQIQKEAIQWDERDFFLQQFYVVLKSVYNNIFEISEV